jgi:hypothetical protein
MISRPLFSSSGERVNKIRSRECVALLLSRSRRFLHLTVDARGAQP